MNVGLPSETIKNAAIRIKQLEHENAELRKDLERFTGGGMLDCHAICNQRDKLEQENAELRKALNTALAIESLDNDNLIELIKRLITVKEENNL